MILRMEDRIWNTNEECQWTGSKLLDHYLKILETKVKRKCLDPVDKK